MLILLVLLIGAVIAAGLFSVNFVLGVIGVVLLVVIVAVLGLVGSALSGIFTIALYRYATQGNAGFFFDAGTLQGAFKVKR